MQAKQVKQVAPLSPIHRQTQTIGRFLSGEQKFRAKHNKEQTIFDSNFKLCLTLIQVNFRLFISSPTLNLNLCLNLHIRIRMRIQTRICRFQRRNYFALRESIIEQSRRTETLLSQFRNQFFCVPNLNLKPNLNPNPNAKSRSGGQLRSDAAALMITFVCHVLFAFAQTCGLAGLRIRRQRKTKQVSDISGDSRASLRPARRCGA